MQQLQQQPQKASGQAGKQQSGERHSQSESKGAAPKQPSSSTVTSGQAFAKVAAGLGGGGAGGSTRPSQQQKAPGQRQPSLSFSNKQQQSKQGGDQNQAASGSGNQRNQQSGQHQLTTGHRDGQGGQNGFMGPRQHRQQNNQQNRVIGENANPNFHRNNNGQQQHQGFRSYNANRFVPRNQQSGGFVPGGQFGFGRGGYNNGPRGMGHRNFIPRGPMGAHPAGPKFPPLPDGDFDFEKAQADFKVLEEKLMSLRINGTLPSSSEGGDAPAELPEVPGIPASALTVAALEEEDISKEPCYNKTKSFFDSISCEALEREKGYVFIVLFLFDLTNFTTLSDRTNVLTGRLSASRIARHLVLSLPVALPFTATTEVVLEVAFITMVVVVATTNSVATFRTVPVAQ